MSKVQVRITAQIFENYNYFEENSTANWKPKGSQIFILFADSDLFLYDSDVCVKAISKMLEEQSNNYVKFQYIGCEILFHEETKLNTDTFEALFNKFAQDKYTLTHNA